MATAKRLILASGSTGRRWLLSQAGYAFEVVPSGVDEPLGEGVTEPRDFVHQVAWSKAAAVARRLGAAPAVVVAADSVVWHGGQVIGKPTDEADARRILGRLAGTSHELWSGVVVWELPSQRQVCWQEKSVVAFRALDAAELDALVATRDWEGKSGGYGIQGDTDPYLTVVEGTVSNVVGLPMESLEAELRLLGVRP